VACGKEIDVRKLGCSSLGNVGEFALQILPHYNLPNALTP
jgi:hypothetical protein